MGAHRHAGATGIGLPLTNDSADVLVRSDGSLVELRR
jgi:hypothetical protein